MPEIKMAATDAMRAASVSAYWEGFIDGVKAAAMQARGVELNRLISRAAPPDQPAPNGTDKPNGAAHSGAPAA